MDTKASIKRAVELLGGPVQAARVLGGLRYQAVQQWIETGRVPAKYCPRIERELNGRVRCEDLLPEVDWTYLRRSQATVSEVALAACDPTIAASHRAVKVTQ